MLNQRGAELVVTDNVRGSKGDKAIELAKAIERELGITAKPSSNITVRQWI